jgi:formylglycine-generating enzyme required for sulfatase activity
VGNVAERCWDWYGATTYVDGATDPRGAESGSDRVARGGSWEFNAFRCRISFRDHYNPGLMGNVIGFRVARSSVP